MIILLYSASILKTVERKNVKYLQKILRKKSISFCKPLLLSNKMLLTNNNVDARQIFY